MYGVQKQKWKAEAGLALCADIEVRVQGGD
jgi:hypothetical protein